MRSLPPDERTARAVPKIAPIAAAVHAKSAMAQRAKSSVTTCSIP